MRKVFVCFETGDEAFAQILINDLVQAGFPIWAELVNPPPRVQTNIQEGLQTCDIMILVVSLASMASRKIEDQWHFFVDAGKPIIMVFYQTTPIQFQLASRSLYVDFRNLLPGSNGYQRRLKQLQKKLTGKIQVGARLQNKMTQIPSTGRMLRRSVYRMCGCLMVTPILVCMVAWAAGMSLNGTSMWGSTEDDHPGIYDTSVRWAPNSQMIAFVSDREGNEDIYIADDNGENRQRLTRDIGNDYHPAWSPDGRYIAFISDRQGREDLYVIDTQGNNLRLIETCSDNDQDQPYWSDDGKTVQCAETTNPWIAAPPPELSYATFSQSEDYYDRLYFRSADGQEIAMSKRGNDTGSAIVAPNGLRFAFVSYDYDHEPNRAYIFIYDVASRTTYRVED